MEGGIETESLLYLAASVHHGWLRVFDVRGPPTHRISCGKSHYERAIWNPKFCVVTESQLLLLDKEQIHPFLLQERRAESCRARLLRRTVSVPSESQFPEFLPDDLSVEHDSPIERSGRRRSMPGSTPDEHTAMETPISTPFRVTDMAYSTGSVENGKYIKRTGSHKGSKYGPGKSRAMD
eukprot:gi/632969421/ref/XP_007901078.1/ PREDICTED: ras/Rap GTPase-activating protein SynGAP-like [Callorhinchus milii]